LGVGVKEKTFITGNAGVFANAPIVRQRTGVAMLSIIVGLAGLTGNGTIGGFG